MSGRSQFHAEMRATKRRRQLRALRTGILLGLLCSIIVAILVYGLYSISKF